MELVIFRSSLYRKMSFFLWVQTGSGAHPASYSMGTSYLFPGQSDRGARLTTGLSSKEYAQLCLRFSLRLHDAERDNITLTLSPRQQPDHDHNTCSGLQCRTYMHVRLYIYIGLMGYIHILFIYMPKSTRRLCQDHKINTLTS